MAQVGVILPQEPILIVDKSWRVGPRAQETRATLGTLANNNQLRLAVIKDTAKSIVTSKAQKRKVAASTQVSRPGRRSRRPKCTDRTDAPDQRHEPRGSSKESLENEYVGHRNGFDLSTVPMGSANAFYGHLDPHLTAKFSELLKYYPETVYTCLYPLVSKVNFDVNPIGKFWLPLALTDGALLHTIALSSVVRIHATQPSVCLELKEQLSEAIIRFLNCRVKSDELSDATVGAVSCMTLIEGFVGHKETSKIHHDGLLGAISQRGGIEFIERPLQMKILRAVVLPWVDGLERPRLPRFLRTARPLYSLMESQLPHDEDYVPRLTELGLRTELIKIFIAMRRLSTALEHAISHSVTINARSYDEDTLNIFHDLLSGLQTTSHLDDRARYAAIAYMNIVTREDPFTARHSRGLVKAHIEAVKADVLAGKNNDLLLWTLIMGSLASSQTSQYDWFRSRLAACILDLGIETWRSCRNRLRSIVWVNDIHDCFGEALWNEIASSTELYSVD